MPFVNQSEKKRQIHRSSLNSPKKSGGRGRGWKDAPTFEEPSIMTAEVLLLAATGKAENDFSKALESLIEDRVSNRKNMASVAAGAQDRCWYCGCEIIHGLKTPNGRVHAQAKTKDHIVPRSRGGKRTVPCCHRCNSRKKSMSLEEFRQAERPKSDRLFWAEKKLDGATIV